jgi:tRNA-dihydrouridine synthase B
MADTSAFKIGSWKIQHPTILAPMAGVSDEPFRRLCYRLGAGMTVSEMVTSDIGLWSSRKSRQRLLSTTSTNPTRVDLRSVQLAGNDPTAMAIAAKANQDLGADVIDLNMGCPAKKVCKKAAGSALLRDEKLVANILSAVVKAVDIPVTLKIRTGWSPEERNGLTIAKIAEQSGISALAVHGRTRACAFKGQAEYDTIATIVNALTIPVFANGDIDSPEKAKAVLDYTGASAVMIGRAAQGNPWIFREINHYLQTGERLAQPAATEVCTVLQTHLQELHHFYDELMGVRIARKHVGWYLKQQSQRMAFSFHQLASENHHHSEQHNCYEIFRQHFNQIEVAEEQYKAVQDFFDRQLITIEHMKGEIAA